MADSLNKKSEFNLIKKIDEMKVEIEQLKG